MRMRPLAFVYAMTLVAAGAGAADDSALQVCRAEPDDARRLACYDRVLDRADRAAGRARSATAGQSSAPTPPPVKPSPPPPLTAEERFGREAALAREEVERMERESRELGELKALVAEIQTRSDGLMVVTLDNGQVWKQARPDSFFRLKAGDSVRIEPAALNSFLMWGTSKRPTRVSRIR